MRAKNIKKQKKGNTNNQENGKKKWENKPD